MIQTAKNKDIDVNELIENASIVFDTSSLGKLYHLTDKNKESMLNILREHFKERIWIPSWVWREYQRNRKKLLAQPISDCYKMPKFLESKNHDYLHFLKDHINSLNISDNFHPYFDAEYIEEMNGLHKQLQVIVDSIRCKTKKVYKQKHAEIRELTVSDDEVYNTLNEFKIATSLSFDKIIEIVREGDVRYRNCIPPGYMDAADKVSIDKFGDLIIWKEIIEHSSADKRDIVFICNDLKQDWYSDSNHCIPREELIYEFSSITGNTIAIITLESFISKLNGIYSQSSDLLPLWDGIESIHQELLKRKLSEQQEKRRRMIVECYDCKETVEYDLDDLDIEWYCESVTYGKHGESISTYRAEFWLDCPNCGSEHEIEIEVTIEESCGNKINCTSSDNCSVKKISQAIIDSISENKFEQCQRCGEWLHEYQLNDSGLCTDCEDYYLNMD